MRLFYLLLVAVLSTGISCKQSLETTIAKTSHSVAIVETDEGFCSSFYVGNNNFLTAAHCLPDNLYSAIYLTFEDGSSQAVGIKTTDIDHDLAVLYTLNDVNLPALKIWDEDKPLIAGQQILTVGFPAYLNENFAFEVGYLINISYSKAFKRDFIIARNLANSGESGGPVVDVDSGRVIGMVDKGAEHVELWATPPQHTHAATSLITPFYDITPLLDKIKPQPEYHRVFDSKL